MDAVTSTTFEVSDVERATSPLPEVPCKQAVETLLSGGITQELLRHFERLGVSGPMGLPPTWRIATSRRAHATRDACWTGWRSTRSSPPSTTPSWATGRYGCRRT